MKLAEKNERRRKRNRKIKFALQNFFAFLSLFSANRFSTIDLHVCKLAKVFIETKTLAAVLDKWRALRKSGLTRLTHTG